MIILFYLKYPKLLITRLNNITKGVFKRYHEHHHRNLLLYKYIKSVIT